MTQRKTTESVRRVNYLSVKVSKVLNTEGIQVSKHHDLELKQIIENNDNPYYEQMQMALFW